MFDVIDIEDVSYGKCTTCLNWRPADELVWNDESLGWVCYDADCASALVV